MVKKAPITAAYQVNLYCDNCGKIMKYNKFENSKYIYHCECGHVERSEINYPHQIVEFDLSKEEVVI